MINFWHFRKHKFIGHNSTTANLAETTNSHEQRLQHLGLFRFIMMTMKIDCVYVCSCTCYIISSTNAYSTRKVRTFLESENGLAGPYNFKGLFEG